MPITILQPHFLIRVIRLPLTSTMRWNELHCHQHHNFARFENEELLWHALLCWLQKHAKQRNIQAAYALHVVGDNGNAHKDTSSSSIVARRASGSNRQMRYAVEDDLGFAQCVHAAWINQFGDPAAAVAALKYVLVCNGLTHPVAVSGVDVPLGESVEKRSEYSGGMLSTVPCGEAIADQQASIQLEMQKRIARYNSSTLLRLLQQRAGVATAAGRAEASNYLQILSRHNLSDVYHYTIVLNACCEPLASVVVCFCPSVRYHCRNTTASGSRWFRGLKQCCDVYCRQDKRSRCDPGSHGRRWY